MSVGERRKNAGAAAAAIVAAKDMVAGGDTYALVRRIRPVKKV
jgi:hypothetical protein